MPELNRLSQFPDEILHAILSFLPIKEVIRTCVLSRRWEHLWKSIPRLHFHREEAINSDRLINFVHTVCRLHDPRFPIQSFTLGCDLDDRHAQRIYAILSSPIITAAQQISLHFYNHCQNHQLLKLPDSIFRSETLVKIEIRIMTRNKTAMELSPSVHLPRLKFLRLQRIRIPNLTLFEVLVSSCPFLEELLIRDCFWMNTADAAITICNPNLKEVAFYYSMPPLRLHDCENVKKLMYHGDLVHEFLITGRPPKKLVNLVICLASDSNVSQGLRLLSSLSTTKKLTIYAGCFQSLSSLESDLILGLPQFNNLVELSLHGFNSLGVLVDTLLRKSPSLQSLFLQGIWDELWLESTPLCFHTQLKKIRVSVNEWKDVDLIAKLSEISQVLEEVVLHIPYPKWETNGLVEMVRERSKLSKNYRIAIE